MTLQRRSAPFLRRSGLPFLTVAMTMSPQAAAGRRLRRAPQPTTEMMYRFLAPVLSAQFMMAPTGSASDMPVRFDILRGSRHRRSPQHRGEGRGWAAGAVVARPAACIRGCLHEMQLVQPPSVSALGRRHMASQTLTWRTPVGSERGAREASRLMLLQARVGSPGFATDENSEPSSERSPAPLAMMLRRSSALLRRACSQAIASSSTLQGSNRIAGEQLYASGQLSRGSSGGSPDGWATFACPATSAWSRVSRAYSSGPNITLGSDSFPHAASSSSSSSSSSGGVGSDAPDVDTAGVLDADAISSAAALAESDALLQATEAAWYPTIGVQKLVELVHDQGNLPWCV